jgi:FkbM family methyltransferase
MYLVGVVNKIACESLKAPAISQSSLSIVRILDAWTIPRFSVLHKSANPNLFACVTSSPSQMAQDALALIFSGTTDSPFFVEAGACDGIYCSNTWLLEREYGWSGILCEPARVWHRELRQNRRCLIDERALWSTSGERLQFRQTALPNLSTLNDFADYDMHSVSRQEGEVYDVESVSFSDLLRTHGAPAYIDFLSLDTEGTELAILREFPFDRYSFGLIVCEHNNTESHEQIVRLLAEHGYTHLTELMSISLGDAWFVGPHLIKRLNQLRSGRY